MAATPGRNWHDSSIRWHSGAPIPDRQCRSDHRELRGLSVLRVAERGLGGVRRNVLKVKPPLIDECPLNVECKVRQTLNLGAHDLLLGEVVAVHANEDALDADGNADIAKIDSLSFHALPGPSVYTGVCGNEVLGSYGFSKGEMG